MWSIGVSFGSFTVRFSAESGHADADRVRADARWGLSDIKGDCPKRDAHAMHQRCDLICPDLPKVL